MAASEAKLLRRFVLSFALTAVAVLGVCVALNWAMDPYRLFGRPRYEGVNDSKSLSYLLSSRDLQLKELIESARGDTHGTWLVGTSQLLFGVDTCADPDVQRFALFRLSDKETAQFMQAVAPTLHSQKTILITAGLTGRATDLPRWNMSEKVRHGLLSWQPIYVAVANYFASRVAKGRLCAPMPYPFLAQPDFAYMHNALVKEGLQPHYQAGLIATLAALAPSCQRYHHRLVVFTLPLRSSPADEYALFQVMGARAREVKEVVARFRAQHSGCSIEFDDFASPDALGLASIEHPNEWFDELHFRPAFGDGVLRRLLQHPREERNTALAQ